MTYVGPVARIRQEMERERAAAALGGARLPEPDECALSQNVLRDKLLKALSFEQYLILTPHLNPPGKRRIPWRPWRLGTDMVGPEWMWQGVARVLNDPDVPTLLEVWTRKSHKAWSKNTFTTSRVAGAILRGEIKDPSWW